MLMIGLDLGKRNSWIVVAEEPGVIVMDRRIATTHEALGPTFASLAPSRVLMEASTPSEWVARLIETFNHEVIVADPNFGPMYAQVDKAVKTDRRDAYALLRANFLGAYRSTVRRSDGEMHLRALLLSRDGLVRSRTRLVNRTRALLSRFGITEEHAKVADYTHAVLRVVHSSELIAVVEPTLQALDDLTKQVGRLEQQLREIAGKNDVAVRLNDVTGVGLITTLAFVYAIKDPKRFKNARQVVSYLGLAPSERSSGDHQGFRGRITKRGDNLTLSVLVDACHTIMHVSKDERVADLRVWALRIAAKNGEKKGGNGKARVALARRIARILFAMWRDGTDFNPALTTSRSV